MCVSYSLYTQLCRNIKAASVWELGQWLTSAFPSQQSSPVAEVWILHLDVFLETEAPVCQSVIQHQTRQPVPSTYSLPPSHICMKCLKMIFYTVSSQSGIFTSFPHSSHTTQGQNSVQLCPTSFVNMLQRGLLPREVSFTANYTWTCSAYLQRGATCTLIDKTQVVSKSQLRSCWSGSLTSIFRCAFTSLFY